MGLHHLQSGVDVGLMVGMSVRWPVQVKQHQSAAAGRYLQELGQGGHRLVLGPRAVRLRQREHGAKGVPLSESGWAAESC